MQDKCLDTHHEVSSNRSTDPGRDLELQPPVQLFDALSLHLSIVEASPVPLSVLLERADARSSQVGSSVSHRV